uniref:Secreted protein n=1 Tax=Trichogramma kaykai TaxID=54128 RepID=A0ABD2W457_9HYME
MYSELIRVALGVWFVYSCLFGCRDEAAQETCSSRWTVNNATSTSCQRRSAEKERKLLESCYLSKSL